MPSMIIANSIRALHFLILILLIFGSWAPTPTLPYHLILIGVVVCHWWANKGQCLLTQLENRWRGKPTKAVEGQFVTKIFQKFGLQPSKTVLLILIYGILCASSAHSFFRWFG